MLIKHNLIKNPVSFPKKRAQRLSGRQVVTVSACAASCCCPQPDFGCGAVKVPTVSIQLVSPAPRHSHKQRFGNLKIFQDSLGNRLHDSDKLAPAALSSFARWEEHGNSPGVSQLGRELW